MAGVIVATGCTSRVSGPRAKPDAGPTVDMAQVDLFVASDIYHPPDLVTPPGDMACQPKITSCTGLCGPVPDTCTGLEVQCGACTTPGTVCDLKTNNCVIANANPCLAPAASPSPCGTTKNTCGTRFDCGDCASPTQQCDPNTNTCVACQQVQCSDLGYQCGYAWLGCGSSTDPSNFTYCGDCGANQICNTLNNLCEPVCNPSPNPLAVCRAANAALGYNCGIISNGCGGTVDCSSTAVTSQDPTFGCQPGFACAAQGDQNICEPFEEALECVIANRQCGTITSACGGQIDCGSCTSPQVCLSNGLCGAPCTPKTCPPGYQCGFIDDGCGNPMESCGSCPKAGDVCLANHNCCTPETVSGYQNMGVCGNALVDATCGSTLNVPCPNGGLCSTCNDANCATSSTPGQAGTCCNNTATCPTDGTCPIITNSCTGAQMRCGCPTAKPFCDTTTNGGTCIAPKTCASYMANGQNGDPCSYQNAFPDGTGNILTCTCNGNYCIPGTPNPGVNPTGNGTTVQGSNEGVCCTNVGMCQITSGCNGTITNTCISATPTNCSCKDIGKVCDTATNTCVSADTMCSSFTPPATGASAAPCTCTGANCLGSFPGGDGTADANCPCNAGLECVTGPTGHGTVVTGSTLGTCCNPTVGGSVCPAKPAAGTPCFATDGCTGVKTACCGGGFVCNNNTGVCEAKPTCATLEPSDTGGAGAPCGVYTDPATNVVLFCGCSTANGDGNNVCKNGSTTITSGSASGSTGTCTCVPTTPFCTNCGNNGSYNGCGTKCSFTCPGSGDPSGDTTCAVGGSAAAADGCCDPYTCATLPLSPPLGSGETLCGTYNNGCNGKTAQCADCTFSGAKPLGACTAKSGANYDICTCTPTTCAANPNATTDGCGNALYCNACGKDDSAHGGLNLSGDTGAVGAPCGSYTSNGQPLTCGCNTGNGYANNTCVGSPTGTCQCTPNNTCTDCTQNGASNGCGGSKSCACTGAAECKPGQTGSNSNGCCTPLTSCSGFSNSQSSDPRHPICGTYSDTCGGNFSCGVTCNTLTEPTTGLPISNGTCTATGNGLSNCECTNVYTCGSSNCNSQHPGNPICGKGDNNGCGLILNCAG